MVAPPPSGWKEGVRRKDSSGLRGDHGRDAGALVVG